MVIRTRSVVLLGWGLLISCVHAPVPQPRVLNHAHADYEQSFQLPHGSLTEAASIERADDEQVCFAVLLRSFSEVDLHAAEVSLRADGRAVRTPPQIIAAAPSTRTYEGIVYRKHRTGEKVQCRDHRDDGTCAEYGAVPTYTRRPERGDVTIHESRGRVCFAEPDAARASKLSLEVRLELAAAATQPSISGGAFRKQVFNWSTAP